MEKKPSTVVIQWLAQKMHSRPEPSHESSKQLEMKSIEGILGKKKKKAFRIQK